MYLYAIKDLNTGLFVSKPSLNYRLEPLGVFSLTFSSEQAALKTMMEKYLDREFNSIANELAWNELEELFQKDRWDINISKEEFNEVVNSYDLKVVKLYLGELDEGDVHAEPEEEDY